MDKDVPLGMKVDPNLWIFLKKLFTADFMPHGHCFFWRPDILWLHVVSDALITFSYYSIPLALIYFARKRHDVPFSFLFLMFGAFIFLCGTTHLVEIVTLWLPVYRFQGLTKLLTAVVSMATALVLVPIIPQIVAFPGTRNLVKQLSEKSNELAEANKNLEHFNNLTTGREARIIELKIEVNRLSKELGRPTPYNVTPL